MQKVERKVHRKRKYRRAILMAAALALLTGGVISAAVLGRPAEKPQRQEDHGGLLTDRNAAELISVTVARRGEEPWTLIRAEDGTLQPEGGGDWNAETQSAEMLTEAVTQLRYEDILSEDSSVYAENPADFGLAEPRVTVTARYTDGTVTTVHVGNDTGLEEGWYYMTAEGDGRLYALSSAIAEDLDVEFALLHPVAKPEIYAALLDRITVKDREGSILAEWALRGEITDRDAAANWAVTVPFSYPADEEAVQTLKKSAENIRLGAYTSPADGEKAAEYGLAEPRMEIIFHMAAGSTGTVGETGIYDIREHEERTVTLLIGNARDELADYVRFGDEIFTVSHFTLSVFTEPDPMGTTARYPVLTPLASLESLTEEENGEIREYVLRDAERTEENQEKRREVLLNGGLIAWETFEAAYDRLLTVTFSGTLPREAVWEKPYKKYTFRTMSGGTHTVELCSWDGVHDAVTVDGSTLFYLIKGGMTELPQAAER